MMWITTISIERLARMDFVVIRTAGIRPALWRFAIDSYAKNFPNRQETTSLGAAPSLPPGSAMPAGHVPCDLQPIYKSMNVRN